MPLHLKQCFAYCARLPKDVEIRNLDLIAEWIAHGLIQPSSDNHLEDIWNQYFLELLSRSLFQHMPWEFNNLVCHVKMHDLVHDFAMLVAGKEVSHFKYDMQIIYEGTRHLLFSATELEGEEFPQCISRLHKVRSFAFEYQVGFVSKKFLDTLIETFKCLRVLSLHGSQFEKLPSSIGILKHLRLLRIAGNSNITELPNTICNLVNLQALDTSDCVMLQDLPRDLGFLYNLRTLRLTCQMKVFPVKGLAEGLSSLQYLSISSCYKLESLLEEMHKFTPLRHLSIEECPSLTFLASESIKLLRRLEYLMISNCEKLNLLEEESKTMELPRGLLSLSLVDMPNLKELPHGFESASASIKYIYIYNCSNFDTLTEWLQKCTSLEKLLLVNCSGSLHEKCETETSKYWTRISHIPEITSYYYPDSLN